MSGAPTPGTAAPAEAGRLRQAAWPALGLVLTVWLFGPATIYFTNILEFNYSFRWLLLYLLAGAAASLLLLALPLAFLPRRGFRLALALLTVLAGMLWLQGNFLVWNYGPLDGRDIPWGRLWHLGAIDGALWLGAFGLALWRPGAVVRRARSLAALLIVLQALWLGWLVLRAPKVPSFQHYTLDESGKYSFSAQRNALVLLLDTFQSDVFQELLNEDPAWRSTLRGFTYYRNALAAAPKTFTAVPALLTGRAYDNSRPLLDFIEDAYMSPASLPRRLGAAGYRVEIYPYPGTEKTVFFDEAVAANMVRRSSRRVLAGQLGQLLDISLFRQLPHAVKPFVYNDQAWWLKRWLSPPPDYARAAPRFRWDRRFDERALQVHDVQFISQLLANADAAGRVPAFKFYHLNGLHRPLVLDGRLHYRPMASNSRAAFTEQGRAALAITRLFLDKLRELGVYDRSLIVVMGDHGNADYPFGVNLEAAGLGRNDENGRRIPVHIKAAALPLLLVKPAGAGAAELQTSDAPVSETDLPRTVVEALGLDAREMAGRAMPDIGAGEARERLYYYYNWNGWGDKYLYSMREYAVNGHAWRDSSWREVGVRRPGDSGEAYAYGTVLHFDRGGNAGAYQGIGWHAPEKAGFTWTREKRAELFLAVAAPRRDLLLRLRAAPYLVPGRIAVQDVGVEVNGRRLGRLSLSQAGPTTLRMTVPRALVRDGTLHLVLDIPGAAAPADLGLGADIRFLGLAVYALVLAEEDRADAINLERTPTAARVP